MKGSAIMAAPFASLSFTIEEAGVIIFSMELLQEDKTFANSRKQRQTNNLLIESATNKLSNLEKSFSVNKLRIMHASLLYFSILVSNGEFDHESESDKFIVDSASQKVSAMLLQAGIDIDSI